MPLQKQDANINFSKGLDLKTDPFQVEPGKFLSLKNSIFSETGQLKKRNGFGYLKELPSSEPDYVTTFNGNLTAIGNEIYAYNSGTNSWVGRGSIKPLDLSVLPLIHDNINQSQCDAAVSPTNLVCVAYTESNGTTTSYKFAVADGVSGQNLIAPTAITPVAGTVTGSPRVFVLGNYFVVVYTNTITAADNLEFIAINYTTLVVDAAVSITSSYVAASGVSFDGVVANNSLYLAWPGASASGIKMKYLDSTLTLHGAGTGVVVDASHQATLMSLCADTTGSTPVIYLSYYNSSGTTGYIMAVNGQLDEVLAPTQFLASGTLVSITSSAQNAVATILYEYQNAYSYDATIRTDYVAKKTCTVAGSVSSETVVKRSIGLASKSFIEDGTIYFLGIYSSTYQPTYFLSDSSGNIVAKLAYQNGGGYLASGLPGVSVNDGVISVAYLFKDLIQAVNKNTNVPSGTQTAGIYSQLGINLARFDIGTESLRTAELGKNLHLSGGFLWMYDGYLPVEEGFFLYPDVTASGVTILADFTKTGDTSTSVNPTVITNMSNVTNVTVGMKITGTGIPANTTVVAVGTTTITISAAATATNAGTTLTFAGNLVATKVYYYQVTYEWTDNQGNAFRSAPSIPQKVTASAGNTSAILKIPTLRLTYKTANPVKIVIYRWGTDQQNYYQTTSITQPLLNSTTTDEVTYIDVASDAAILGNNLIYTTGGVVENIAPPAIAGMNIFKSRLMVISAEDRDTLLYSKQVIPGTPVEMSDLFSIYVNPTIGVEGNTGPMRCTAAMDDKEIIFKDSAIYYFTGTGPDNTGANNDFSEPVFITSTVGCNNARSIVFTPNGLMFQYQGQIWILKRNLSTAYIGAQVEGLTSSAVTSAVTVPGTTQVRFTFANGTFVMYDFYYDQWGEFSEIPAVSSTIYEGLHTLINDDGKTYRETPGKYLDGTSPVLMSFTTSWLNFAGLQGYERAYYFYLLGVYYTPHKLSIQVAFDYAQSPQQSLVVSPQNYSANYGQNPSWGNPSGQLWGGPGSLEQWKIDLVRQTFESFQISVAEVFDPFFGTEAGPGLTLSGVTCTVGLKKGRKPIPASHTTG